MLINKLKIYLKSIKDKLFSKMKRLYITIIVFIVLFVIIILPSSFAIVQPVKSVEIFSKNLNYKNNEAGAWKVTESAKWISKDKAKLKIEVDSITKENSKDMDVVLVVDRSISMIPDNKLNNSISALNDTIDKIITSKENRIALIGFNDNYEMLSDFTDDKNLLNNKINALTPSGSSSYYQALVGVDKVLQNYQKEDNRECVVLFLTGSYPYKDSPNEKAYYKYLKSRYPYVTINTVQYGIGNSTLKKIKDISDNIFVTNDNLNDTLFQATNISESYDNFSLTDYIDSNYFKIESVSSSEGNTNMDKDSNFFTWNIDVFKTGSKASLEVELLRVNYESDYFVLDSSIEVKSKIVDIEDKVITTDSPILKDKYQVSYDGNFPSGCSFSGVPSTEIKNVFDTVGVSDVKLKCSGYQFKGWKLKTGDVENLNDDYFIMPESDVVFVAEWSKTSLKKSVDGTIYVHVPPVLQVVGSDNYNNEIWAYKSSITKIIIQDEISNISGTIQSYDISDKKDGKVLGKIVSNGNSTYTAYIQGDGKIMANNNSSYFFYDFPILTSIEGLAYLDTSNVIYMHYMFGGCLKITNLDLRSFNTSRVVNMGNLFYNCYELENLNLSSFDTSKVTSMSGMFCDCHSLKKLNLLNFNTSQVTSMNGMFGRCTILGNLDLSNFDTSKVTNMAWMFTECHELKSLIVDNFDTSKVVSMQGMFASLLKLTSLNLKNFKFNSVTTTASMFEFDYYLNLTITIDNSNILNYGRMFLDSAIYNNSKIIVNYTNKASSLVDKMIATKSSNSNVVKGSRVG